MGGPVSVLGWVELNWLFNVTINDISVIYVTAHGCASGLKKKLDLRSGSQRHRHFVGFFNVPTDTDHPFYTVIPTHRPHLVAFYDTLGIRRTHSRIKPPASSRGLLDGHWTLRNVYGVRTRPPAHLCRDILTEISFNVTLHNQYHSYI